MNKELAAKIYDILIEYGADPDWRNEFVKYVDNEDYPLEWRFSGEFGFGGKLRLNRYRCYVDYYQEDKTSLRDERLVELNARIKEIVK